MNCARNCENLLNFVKVIHTKTLLVSFFPDTVYRPNLIVSNVKPNTKIVYTRPN